MASWRTGPSPAAATGSTQPEQPSFSVLNAAAEPAQAAPRDLSSGTRQRGRQQNAS